VSFPGSNPGGVQQLVRQIERKQREKAFLPDPLGWENRQRVKITNLKPILDAAAEGDIAGFAERLTLSPTMDVNASDPKRGTALHCAVLENKVDMVMFLCQLVDIDVNALGPKKVTPLMLAIRERHLDTIAILLQHRGTDVNLKDAEGNAPIHAAVKSGSTFIVKAFLGREDLKLDVKGSDGKTPLALAEKLKFSEIAKIVKEDLRPS
jgi:ankyrin repeat protein